MQQPEPIVKKVADSPWTGPVHAWMFYVVIAWLVMITGFLFYMNTHMGEMRQTEASIKSTQDAIESVVLSTDKVVSDMGSKVKGIESNVLYIVHKVRR
jgi:hypothetical protein